MRYKIPFISLDNKCPMCRIKLSKDKRKKLKCPKCKEVYIYHYLNDKRYIVSKIDTIKDFDIEKGISDDIWNYLRNKER